MTEKSLETRLSNEIHNLGAQLSDWQNLADALDVVVWQITQDDMPKRLHRHRDALIGVSDAMQRLSEVTNGGR
ncbi:hypothetical protein [Aquicoccus sp. SU-CL01552]|uniref:hypothetical protein n=1 Tax=Aquicoccus sp. SU-CL01552 TaxID=3127656 RepID=UPI0031044359